MPLRHRSGIYRCALSAHCCSCSRWPPRPAGSAPDSAGCSRRFRWFRACSRCSPTPSADPTSSYDSGAARSPGSSPLRCSASHSPSHCPRFPSRLPSCWPPAWRCSPKDCCSRSLLAQAQVRQHLCLSFLADGHPRGGLAPELLQPVEGTRFRREDVHHDIEVVHQDPIPLAQALDAARLELVLALATLEDAV